MTESARMRGPRGARRSGLVVLVDVGNTNTVFGIYQGDDLIESFRLSTSEDDLIPTAVCSAPRVRRP